MKHLIFEFFEKNEYLYCARARMVLRVQINGDWLCEVCLRTAPAIKVTLLK